MPTQSLPIPDMSALPEPLMILDMFTNTIHQTFSALSGIDKIFLGANETCKGIWSAFNALSGFQPPKV